MYKLLLSLHINRPDINLAYASGFRVFDIKSLRLCDQSVREGCFGRHKKTSYIAWGAIYVDTHESAGSEVRTSGSAGTSVTNPLDDIFIRGIGSERLSIGFSYDFEENDFPRRPKEQWGPSISSLVAWERFCDAMGRPDLIRHSDVVWFGSTVSVSRRVLYDLRGKIRGSRTSM